MVEEGGSELGIDELSFNETVIGDMQRSQTLPQQAMSGDINGAKRMGIPVNDSGIGVIDRNSDVLKAAEEDGYGEALEMRDIGVETEIPNVAMWEEIARKDTYEMAGKGAVQLENYLLRQQVAGLRDENSRLERKIFKSEDSKLALKVELARKKDEIAKLKEKVGVSIGFCSVM